MRALALQNPLGFARTMIREAMKNGNLVKSLKNCHVKGLDSYVLYDSKKEGGFMLRIFFAYPGSLDNIYDRNGNFILGIHNHRFDISFIPILGAMVNVRTEILPNPTPESTRLHEFSFSSAILNGAMSADYQKPVDATPLREDVLMPGMHATMKAEELHTVRIKNSEATEGVAWIVIEGPDINPDSLIYGTKEKLTLNREELYQTMTKEEVIPRLQWLMERI